MTSALPLKISRAAAHRSESAITDASASIVLIAAVIFLNVYFVAQRACRGYIPGLLIGAALTCVVPVGIVAAICWSK